MATRQGIFLLALIFTPAWGQEAPTCLSPASTGGHPNKDACCLGPDRQEEAVDGIIYQYICNHYATNTNVIYHDVSNAYDCAKKCSETSTCRAASWKPTTGRPDGGRCFLAMAGFIENSDPNGEWVLLVQTDRTVPVASEPPIPPPLSDCQDELDEAVPAAEEEEEELDLILFMQEQLDEKDADIVNCKHI
ncbi:hypothetical protein BDV26DRAFT_257379 [Aspergillus bertholletiae]|uniref:Apple domain-containing protein n=1 Tax=Aspergillus bertholletiae TaxID=1226010 RepID=A0A5N7BFA5_9EURO|nr:hypothetical protein BDV26DRAFT_257379 [Aspergillus bertholletiae]